MNAMNKLYMTAGVQDARLHAARHHIMLIRRVFNNRSVVCFSFESISIQIKKHVLCLVRCKTRWGCAITGNESVAFLCLVESLLPLRRRFFSLSHITQQLIEKKSYIPEAR